MRDLVNSYLENFEFTTNLHTDIKRLQERIGEQQVEDVTYSLRLGGERVAHLYVTRPKTYRERASEKKAREILRDIARLTEELNDLS